MPSVFHRWAHSGGATGHLRHMLCYNSCHLYKAQLTWDRKEAEESNAKVCVFLWEKRFALEGLWHILFPVGDVGSPTFIDPAAITAEAVELLLLCKYHLCGNECHCMHFWSAMTLLRAVPQIVRSNSHSHPKLFLTRLLKANSGKLCFLLPPLSALHLEAFFLLPPLPPQHWCRWFKAWEPRFTWNVSSEEEESFQSTQSCCWFETDSHVCSILYRHGDWRPLCVPLGYLGSPRHSKSKTSPDALCGCT